MITGDNALFLLLQVFSSGVAGYITNKYAVNMIFKEYTPLKIGGAVKKNKEKFIEEISELVEKDIINSNTIKDKVFSDDFKNSIKNMSRDLFQESLYEVFENKKIEDIPAYLETLENGEILLKNTLNKSLPMVIENLCEHIKIEKILSEKQISHISGYIYDEIIKNIDSNENLKSLVSDLYENEGNIHLNQLISKESGEKVTRIICCEIINSIDELLENKKEVKSIIDKTFSLVDIKSVLKSLQKTIGSKTLDEVISEEEFEKLNTLIYEKLDALIKSENGKKHLENIIEEVLISSKNMELTLFEVLPVYFGQTSSEYIVSLIKKLMPYLSSWILNNKEKIEEMIDSSIFKSVENINDELRKSMILKVKDSMLTDFSSKNNIVYKIKEFLNTYELNEETSSEIYLKITKFLEEVKVKDLIELLEKNNLINKEKIVNLVIEKWNSDGKKLSEVFLKRESSKTLQKLIDMDLGKLFNKNIKPKIYEIVEDNKSKILSYMDSAIFNLIHDKIETLLNSEIKSLFNEESVNKFSNMLPNKLVNLLNKKSNSYKESINILINRNISNIDLKNILKSNEEIIINSISENCVDFVSKTINNYKSYEIKDVLDKINENKNLSEEVSEELYNGVKNNLPNIVDGKVKKLIYDNLIKLDEDEICNIAQSFMGEQLRPLSMFGAFLGCIVGLIFGITMSNINGSYGFYNNVTNTLISCILMAGIGVLTNVIAIWMIFCPYEQNKFIAKIPLLRKFSMGYIPSHKSSFASGMAYFIDEELLSGNRVKNSFKSYKEKLKDKIMTNLHNSNYMVALNFIKNKQHTISQKSYDLMIKLVKKHNETICEKLVDNSIQIKCDSFASFHFINDKIKNYLENTNKFEEKLISYAEEKLKINKSLEDLLPKEILSLVNNKVESDINEFIVKKLDITQIENIIKNIIIQNEYGYNLIMDKSIREVMGEKSINSILRSLKTDKFMNILLLGIKSQLNDYTQVYMENELGEEKRFGEIFNSQIKEQLDKNIYGITEKGIDLLIKYIKSNDEKIYLEVIKIIRQNLNFFIRMAYDFADGDGLVKDVINLVVNNKLEELIKEDTAQISVMLYTFLEREVYSSQIKDLGIKSTDINVNLILDRLVFNLKQNENFKITMHETYDIITKSTCEIKVKDITKILNIEDINIFYDKYKDYLNLITSEIITNLKNNEEEFKEFISDLIEVRIMNHFYSVNIVEISWELNREDVSYFISNLLNIVENSKTINNHLMNLCNFAYDNSIKDSELSNLLDKNILKDDLVEIINSLVENEDFNTENKHTVKLFIEYILENNLEFMSNESKYYVSEQLIESILKSIEINIIPLLKSLDLESIALKEVNHMHPKEIHNLFKAFAGDFFRKLYAYGAFGLIFGVNLYLSIILLIIDTIYSRKTEYNLHESKTRLFKE